MENQTLHDLANDISLCIQAVCQLPVVLLGQAFGNVLDRVVTTDHPHLVRAVVLAAAEASKVPPDVAKTPFIASDPACLKCNVSPLCAKDSSLPVTTLGSG